tara:strand:- start:210 stop:488 length:279 start_codon:yes stop_codon:yes gene_type:complete
MNCLSENEIQDRLLELNGWNFNENAVQKTFTFETYMESIGFINRLAEKAEETNHHPDMVVGWCRVDLAFTSHDQGGVTLACIQMAKAAESVL